NFHERHRRHFPAIFRFCSLRASITASSAMNLLKAGVFVHLTQLMRSQKFSLQIWPVPMTRVGGESCVVRKSDAATNPCVAQNGPAAGLPQFAPHSRQMSSAKPLTIGRGKSTKVGS